MSLLRVFLERLQENGYTRNDVRFLAGPTFLKSTIKGSINRFSKENRINRGSLYQMFSGKRAVPLDILDRLQIQPVNMKCIVRNSNVPIQIPETLTNELAYLVGALRDGTVAREGTNEYLCAYYNKDLEFIQNIQKLVQRTFDTKTRIEKFRDVYGVRIRSLTLYLFSRLVLGVPAYQEDWETSELIRSGTNEIKRQYISGFWDAEGICPRIESLEKAVKKNLYTGFVQKNKKSLEFIKQTLHENGIETGEVHWNNGVWVLKIATNSIIGFADYIQPQHPPKAARLALLKTFYAD